MATFSCFDRRRSYTAPVAFYNVFSDDGPISGREFSDVGAASPDPAHASVTASTRRLIARYRSRNSSTGTGSLPAARSSALAIARSASGLAAATGVATHAQPRATLAVEGAAPGTPVVGTTRAATDLEHGPPPDAATLSSGPTAPTAPASPLAVRVAVTASTLRAAACTAGVATTRAALSIPARSSVAQKGLGRKGAAPRPAPDGRAIRGISRHANLKPARTASWTGCTVVVATTASFDLATRAITSSTRGSPTRSTFSGTAASDQNSQQEGKVPVRATTVATGTCP